MAAVDRSLVANLPMFAGLSPAEQDELLRESRSVRYPKGSAVFEQGAEANRFFTLLHGHLRVEKTTPQGQQSVVRYVSKFVAVRDFDSLNKTCSTTFFVFALLGAAAASLALLLAWLVPVFARVPEHLEQVDLA